MKGRTLPAVRGSSSYVQINVYDTNLRELRERGVDIKHMLQHIGCRSVVMDVPILSPQSQNVPLCRRFKTFGVFDARSASIRNDCVSNCDNIIRRRRANSVVIKREEGNSEELFVDQCDYELGVAKESGVTASGTTVMDFSVSHVGEGNRGPLTSTPMFEKTFNHFEAFISQNIVDESPSRKSIHQTSHEGNLSNRPQKNFPCTHGETTHTEQETLFQDCLEDADSSMEYAERFEHLTLSLKTDCDSSPGKGNPVGSHLTVGAPPCTSNSLELECIPSRDPAVGSVLKKEEMDEPEACDRTMVADVSFRSFSCEVVQSLQSLNSVTETDLNKTMACHDCDERNSGDVHLCGNDGEVALNVDKAPSSATLGQPTSEEDNSYHLYEAKSMAVKKNNESSKVFSNSESSSSIQRTQGNVKHYEITSGGLERYIHENSAAEAKILKDFRSQDVEDSPKPHERSSRSRRKRARSQDSEEVDEATEAVKQESGQNHRENPSTVNDVIKVFHCHMKGCGRDLTWRPRYGKNRLVEHVRTHWPNLVKCCKICDFKASSVKKVIYHHKCTHRDVPYTGAKSLETKKDMEQLVDLWKECFPGLDTGRVVKKIPSLLYIRDVSL